MGKRAYVQKSFQRKSFVKHILSFFVEYKWLVLFFIPFLALQLFQLTQLHWDTTAYIFGGKWFCGQQQYFEFIRPPLPAFLNCLSGAGEYSMLITTAFACFMYLAALILIFSQHSSRLNQFIFAAFAFLFPAILFNSNFGSDLLALAFLLLAFAAANPFKKGIFFGLATLSRYNFFLFIVVLLFELRKKPRDIPKFALSVFLLWVPWMVYNYLFTGNPFFSVYESTYLNVQMKGVIAPLGIEQILFIAAFIIVLFLFDIWYKLKQPLNQTALIAVVMFIFSGIKEMRFINTLVPALAFNAALLSKRSRRAGVVLMLLLVLAIIFFTNAFFSTYPLSNPQIPSDSFVHSCRVASDKWVFFYYEGIIAETAYDIGDWNNYLTIGGNFVLYNYADYNLEPYVAQRINREGYVILKSDSCAPQPKKYVSGSLRNLVYKWLVDSNSKIYDYSDWVN